MKRVLVVVTVAVISLFIFWMPFLFRVESFWGVEFGKHGMETIVQNFDGLNYLAVAKTLYDPALLERNFAGFDNPPIYYAAHFPLYPLLIRAMEMFASGPQALLLAIVISNILLAGGLYFFFVSLSKNEKLASTLTIIALFFPARMLSVRGVGTSEPLFMFFVLTSLAMAYRGKHWGASILGSLAVLTRSPGIFLFGAYLLAAGLTYRTDWRAGLRRIWPYILMPLSLILLFAFYGHQYGNFWAYFNSSSELHPVFFPPFLIFGNGQHWISDMWREDILYMYLLYGAGTALFIKKVGIARAGFGMIYGIFLLLISHRDLARYALPLAPFALFGFAPYLSGKNVKWLALLFVPIFLLGWQFVVANVQPVSDWSSLL